MIKYIKDLFEFILFKFFLSIFFIMPEKIIKKVLDFLAFSFYKLDKKHTNIAKTNLDLIFKDNLDEAKKSDIILKSWKNFFYNLYELIENSNIDKNRFNKKIINIKNRDILDRLVRENKNIISITAHIGNWEFASSFIGLNYKHIVVVGRKINNRFLNKYLLKYRNKNNSSMLTKEHSAKGLIKAIKNRHIVGLVIDQHIDPKKAQIVTFAGLKAPLVDSSARLAKKFDCVIMPIFAKRVNWNRYEIIIEQEIEANRYENILDISQKEADIISNWIYQYPEQWFLQHKRFKEFYEKFY